MNLPVVKYDNLKTSLEKFETMVKNKVFQEILNEGGDPSAILTDKLIRKLGGLGVDGNVIRDHFLETITKRNGQTEQLKFQVENGICRVEVKIDGVVKETVTAEEYFARDDTPNSLSQLILAVDYVAMVDPPSPLNPQNQAFDIDVEFPDLLAGTRVKNDLRNTIVFREGNFRDYMRIVLKIKNPDAPDLTSKDIEKAIRNKHGWKRGNVVFATFKRINIEGIVVENFIYGLSGEQDFINDVKFHHFQPLETRTNDPLSTQFDTEIKISTIIHQKFGKYGIHDLKLYTEIPPCPSCAVNVIKDLIRWYGDSFQFTWDTNKFNPDKLIKEIGPNTYELHQMPKILFDMLVYFGRIEVDPSLDNYETIAFTNFINQIGIIQF